MENLISDMIDTDSYRILGQIVYTDCYPKNVACLTISQCSTFDLDRVYRALPDIYFEPLRNYWHAFILIHLSKNKVSPPS